LLDAIYCSELGLPSTTIITTPFESLASMTAKNLGMTEFRWVVAEHPIWTRNDAWFDEQAEKLAARVLAILQQR
jgi:hypothetical protein